MAERIKVTLRWIQILDKLEPFYKERGEFRFLARVTADASAAVETHFPSEGYYEISDHPAWNKVNFERVIFEGPVEKQVKIELMGEELDFIGSIDRLDHYERYFVGEPASWVGAYGPGDHDVNFHPEDPENMSNWRLAYRIDTA